MSARDNSSLPVGTVLEDKFRITREIGRGGMAAVYEAEHVGIGKRVAVKLLSADLITSRVVRERFLREARATAAVRSPYICDVYDSGTYEERPFLVMELLEGESLYELQARRRRLDPTLTLRIAIHTAKGLAKAHSAGIVHRDLKPENIFLTKNEEGELVAKILDFGLAKFYEPNGEQADKPRLTREGALFGTPAYMSPEQARGQGEVDRRCDLWALGCIVYECLTGRTVWDVDQGVAMILAQVAKSELPKPSKVRSDMPPGFDAWFARALARDPEARFQSAKELSQALHAVLSPAVADATGAREAEPSGSSSFDGLPSPPPLPALESLATSSEEAAGSTAGPPAERGRGWRAALGLLFALGVAATIGWWLFVSGTVGSATGADPDAPPSDISEQPLESEPYALQIGAAQEWLSKGDGDKALVMFREAFQNGGSGLARNLISHAEAATEAGSGDCRLTGLGRPRPFSLSSPPSRPTIALTSVGLVVTWSDVHGNGSARQAYTVVLDDQLRRVSPERSVTPESTGALDPTLFQMGERLGLLYWESSGPKAGVHVRFLHPDGRIAGPIVRLSSAAPHQFNPSVSVVDADTAWVSWSESFAGEQGDLVVRRIDSRFNPTSPAIRLTAFDENSGSVSRPSTSLAGRLLCSVFSLKKAQRGEVYLLRSRLDSDGLVQGVTPIVGDRSPADEPIYSGELQPISRQAGKHDQARISCDDTMCIVAWDDDTGGAFVAVFDARQNRILWHRDLGAQAVRPTVVASRWGRSLVWFEDSRVKLASVTSSSLGKASVLGKVSGFQPFASVIPGKQTGRWYLAWRDFESGHLEAFAARARCGHESQ